MKAVIQCESGGDSKAIGDHGHARGLVQINDLYNSIPPEEAFDPEYSITFMAQEWSIHHQNHWSCYRELY